MTSSCSTASKSVDGTWPRASFVRCAAASWRQKGGPSQWKHIHSKLPRMSFNANLIVWFHQHVSFNGNLKEWTSSRMCPDNKSYDKSPMILANLSQFSAAFSTRSRLSFKAGMGSNSKTWEEQVSSNEFYKKKLASLAAVSPRGIGPLNCISMHTMWGRYKRGRRKSGSDIHCFVLQAVSRHVHVQCQAESHMSWKDTNLSFL